MSRLLGPFFFSRFITVLPAVLFMELTGVAVDFERDVRPILAANCLSCHGPDSESRKGDLRLDQGLTTTKSKETDRAILVPGAPEQSLIHERITHPDASRRMPPLKSGKTLTPKEIRIIYDWIKEGAEWQEHWAFKPLRRPVPPNPQNQSDTWSRNAIDLFVLEKQRQNGVQHSPEADRRTLVRRLYFDLIGLPPPPDVVERFLDDPDPYAYEALVTELLNSPGYGEKWARHWLDVVKYADTHGYDKDKPRPNAWPYRDYVIRSLNEDKPYSRFVEEQIAGDALFPNDPDGVIALGFLAAGPWDFIGHAEVPESKLDGMVARNLDRDDMVSNTLNTFNSVTIQCARCHDHKFDPFTQEHYYNLQAVFASIDKADRAFDSDPNLAEKRMRLMASLDSLNAKLKSVENAIAESGGEEFKRLNMEIQNLLDSSKTEKVARPEAYGWHSEIHEKDSTLEWIELDLGALKTINRIVLYPCHDDFNDIGAGFGFPLRFRILLGLDRDQPETGAVLKDHTMSDFPNPGLIPVRLEFDPAEARFIRLEIQKLAERRMDHIAALSEIQVDSPEGANLALDARFSASSSIEAAPRWGLNNLNDGLYPIDNHGAEGPLSEMRNQLKRWVKENIDASLLKSRTDLEKDIKACQSALESLPKQEWVYAGAVHSGSGAFRGRAGLGPRNIHVLIRGEVSQPGKPAVPGTIPIIPDINPHFKLPFPEEEASRRAALAKWMTSKANPLTWRSIVNRVWLNHFGRGLVATPNDFGRMGEAPSHPELLDWLASVFRDEGQSLKSLHYLILTSATYRQTSIDHPENSMTDSNNKWLWRMNRLRLTAEAVRDSILYVCGKLDPAMGGPGFHLFTLEKPEHSPHYQYHLHDPKDPLTHRKSIYRFVVRSQPDPFMTALDCADSSQSSPVRIETITPIQALNMLNDKFILAMSTQFAQRLESGSKTDQERLNTAYMLTLSRKPTETESLEWLDYVDKHGWRNTCRFLFNLNEFGYID